MSLFRQGHQSPRLELEAIADLLSRGHLVSDVQELGYVLGEVKELYIHAARGLLGMMNIIGGVNKQASPQPAFAAVAWELTVFAGRRVAKRGLRGRSSYGMASAVNVL